MLNHGEFDASEMLLSSYTILRSEGDERFIAIPVFPSRVFRQNALYVRADSPLREPRELKGKRIGVDGLPAGRPIRALRQPQDVRIEALGGAAILEELLEQGKIDALMSVMLPQQLGKTLRRLIPNFREVELAYYRKTRIFPIMHTLYRASGRATSRSATCTTRMRSPSACRG